jgi:transcription-repair coupling factor (superfamily II helicase)
VVSPGEYAVRGGLIDLFPMGSLVPYRVDLFDDEVDSIRTFDPDTQRSLYPVPEVRLLPGREFPMDEAARAHLPPALARKARRRPDQEPHLQGHRPGHRHRRHRVLPAAVLRADRHLLQLPGRAGAVVLHGEVDAALITSGPTPASATASSQPTPSGRCWRPKRSSSAATSSSPTPTAMPRWRCAGGEPTDWARPLPDLAADRNATEPLAAFNRHLESTPARVLIVAESDGRRESLLELLRDHQITPPSVDTLAEFEASDREVLHHRRAAGRRLPLVRARRATTGLDPVHHRDRALRQRAAGAPPPQAGADQQRRRADQGPVGAEGG